MGRHYGQLSEDERLHLFRLHEAGTGVREAARLIGRSGATVSREWRRNSLPTSGYNPISAGRMAMARRKRRSRIECRNLLMGHVDDHLAMGWSPEQIAGRLRLDGADHKLSAETIYRYIYRPKIRAKRLYRYLPFSKARRGRRYFKKRRDPIAGRTSIHERPESANSRAEFGHWEGDLMLFRNLGEGNLLTLVERKTRFVMGDKQYTKTADETANTIIASLGQLPKLARKSITFDNGTEFAKHQKLTDQIGVKTWFCDPHSPWQRGSIENTNGIIRRDMPRKTPLNLCTKKDVSDVIDAINSTPRKCLGYKTPAEAFLNQIQCCT